MGKKIEVDINHLKSIGLSQSQIAKIVKNSEPDHWINKLPFGNEYYSLRNSLFVSPQEKESNIVPDFSKTTEYEAIVSFFDKKDVEFVENKCRLLVEMSNYSFAVNGDWCPDWCNKDEKKFGIVLQNGQARVSENELFNLYVFGVVTKTRNLALDMLEEFKERIETYFNKPFNCYSDKDRECFGNIGHTIQFNDGSSVSSNPTGSSIHNSPDFIGSFTPITEKISKRKKRKILLESDIPMIQELLVGGTQQSEIAELFGYSQGTISRLKKRLGMVMQGRGN